MELAKTEIFTDQQNKISLFAKVFGHPARVANNARASFCNQKYLILSL